MLPLTCQPQEFDAAWTHPGCASLDLNALIVEVNSKLAAPWRMPKAMQALAQQLADCSPPVTNCTHLRALLQDAERVVRVLQLSGLSDDQDAVIAALQERVNAPEW
jgi:hypothetical protein